MLVRPAPPNSPVLEQENAATAAAAAAAQGHPKEVRMSVAGVVAHTLSHSNTTSPAEPPTKRSRTEGQLPTSQVASAAAAAAADTEGAANGATVIYVVELAGVPGKLDMAAADALGVPRGPLLGQLQRGQAVTLPDGSVVQPEQVWYTL